MSSRAGHHDLIDSEQGPSKGDLDAVVFADDDRFDPSKRPPECVEALRGVRALGGLPLEWTEAPADGEVEAEPSNRRLMRDSYELLNGSHTMFLLFGVTPARFLFGSRRAARWYFNFVGVIVVINLLLRTARSMSSLDATFTSLIGAIATYIFASRFSDSEESLLRRVLRMHWHFGEYLHPMWRSDIGELSRLEKHNEKTREHVRKLSRRFAIGMTVGAIVHIVLLIPNRLGSLFSGNPTTRNARWDLLGRASSSLAGQRSGSDCERCHQCFRRLGSSHAADHHSRAPPLAGEHSSQAQPPS